MKNRVIVFTIKRVPQGLKVTTKSLLANENDKCSQTFAMCLMSTMERLTMKYNEQGISVLFEVE